MKIQDERSAVMLAIKSGKSLTEAFEELRYIAFQIGVEFGYKSAESGRNWELTQKKAAETWFKDKH